MNNIAILSNKIYIKPDSQEYAIHLKDSTTYKFIDEFKSKLLGRNISNTVKTYSLATNGILTLPIGRQELIKSYYTIQDERTIHPIIFPKPTSLYPLRSSQREVLDNVTDNCLINAPVSWGKTFTALHIAAKLAQKTLVITHTTILRAQWEAEVKKLFNISPGIIGGGEIINLEKPIVISNVQTLIKFIDKVSSMFGTIIVDECHHTPSSTFSEILSKLKARYKIGLSATLLRKDGQHILFKDYFSEKVFRPEVENSVSPKVVLVSTNISIPPAAHWAYRVTELCSLESYRDIVAKLAVRMSGRGYRVLVVGERVDFLASVSRRCGDTSVCITGETSDYSERNNIIDKIKSGEKTILCGSRSIFSEGISLNELSCLILAAPIANEINLIQLIGRIQRVCEGKKEPVVIDLQLRDNTSKKQQKARLEYYLRMNYKVYSLPNF
jgi:superfamily II DNA or RNA helicase